LTDVTDREAVTELADKIITLAAKAAVKLFNEGLYA